MDEQRIADHHTTTARERWSRFRPHEGGHLVAMSQQRSNERRAEVAAPSRDEYSRHVVTRSVAAWLLLMDVVNEQVMIPKGTRRRKRYPPSNTARQPTRTGQDRPCVTHYRSEAQTAARGC